MAMQTKSMQQLWKESYLTSGNEAYLEELYDTYLTHPDTLPDEWRQFFDQLSQQNKKGQPDVSHHAVKNHFLQLAKDSSKYVIPRTMDDVQDQQQEKVIELIAAFRRLGHLKANTDPLLLNKGIDNPALTL